MNTERRDGRSAPTTEIARWSRRHGSRVALGDDRKLRSEQADAIPLTWSFPASASGPLAYSPSLAARSTLEQGIRKQQPVRSIRLGSPPLGQAARLRPLLDCLTGYPPNSPAVFARFPRTLPHVPAALGCRTERYDGKRNLYFQHAA